MQFTLQKVDLNAVYTKSILDKKYIRVLHSTILKRDALLCAYSAFDQFSVAC